VSDAIRHTCPRNPSSTDHLLKHNPSPPQAQYNGAAAPVPSTQSRRLELALQHIHQGHVTFHVQHASHTSVMENSGILLDYEGVKVRP
jgi:hypothetical protein